MNDLYEFKNMIEFSFKNISLLFIFIGVILICIAIVMVFLRHKGEAHNSTMYILIYVGAILALIGIIMLIYDMYAK